MSELQVDGHAGSLTRFQTFVELRKAGNIFISKKSQIYFSETSISHGK